MEKYIFRLHPNQDLRQEIERHVRQENIQAGCILCAVGSLKQANLRMPDGKSEKQLTEELEIVSATGTVSTNGIHIHLAVAKKKGIVIGGHLKDGCLVNTTAEIVILAFSDTEFKRTEDKSTGFNELEITENK